MNDNKHIKWGALQVLTGGMYFGTEAAIGHPAEFIISYPGFDTVKKDKSGKITDAGNEYYLLEYLKQHNREVPYYQFDRTPFQSDDDLSPKILKDGVSVDHPDYTDLDIVVAVPVCAGLSGASTASTDRKLECNNNMLWLAKYTLNVIKPKVYIFENAPRFMSEVGSPVRDKLEQMASEAGYSIGYYRTDTKWHDNCQNRPRTFIYFFKVNGDKQGTPQIGFEHKNVPVEEFLNRIPVDASMQMTMPVNPMCQAMLDYVKSKFGEEWRSKVNCASIISYLDKENQLDDWNSYVNNRSDLSDKLKSQISRLVDHIHDKRSQGKGFYETSFTLARLSGMPAAMFKTIPYAFHYKEDRLYTIREWLSVMGMPYDFEMPGDVTKTFRKIGQNVPARTAQFVVEQAINIINNWDTVPRASEMNVVLFDNNKQTTDIIKTL